MLKADKFKNTIYITFILSCLLFTAPSWANCSDLDAIAATDKAALKFFKRAELFETGKVLKLHLPSKRKETASYIKVKDLYYTFFGQVELDCSVKIMKRTHARR